MSALYLDSRYKVPTNSTANLAFDQLLRDSDTLTPEAVRVIAAEAYLRERRNQETLVEMTMPIAPVVLEDTKVMPVLTFVDASDDDGQSAVRVLKGEIIRIGGKPKMRSQKKRRRLPKFKLPKILLPKIDVMPLVAKGLYEFVMWGYAQGFWDFKIIRETK